MASQAGGQNEAKRTHAAEAPPHTTQRESPRKVDSSSEGDSNEGNFKTLKRKNLRIRPPPRGILPS